MADIDFRPEKPKIDFQPEELPIKQEQGVGFFERRAIDMLTGKPAEQESYLQESGYQTRRGPGGSIQVKRPEDKEWKLVDPEGITSIGDAIQDTIEALPEIGMTMATGGALNAGLKAGAAKLGQKVSELGARGIISIIEKVIDKAPGATGALARGAKKGLSSEKTKQVAKDVLEKMAKSPAPQRS